MKKIYTFILSTFITVMSWGQCTGITTPNTENFDSETPNNGFITCASSFSFTGCWTNDPTNQSGWIARSSSTGSTGTGPTADFSGSGNYVFLEASGCYNKINYLVSGDFDISSLTTPMVSFQYHMYGTSMGSLTVQVSEDGGTTWTDYWSLSGNQGINWIQANVPLCGLTASSIKVRMKGVTGSGYASDMALDEISVLESTVACASPGNPSFSNVTASSTDISWTVGCTETAWNLEYGPSGFTQGNGTIVALTTTSYSLTGLNPLTAYDVYVQADCGSSVSASSFASVITPCSAETPYYSQDFNSWTFNSMDPCWSEAQGRLNQNTTLTGTSSLWSVDGFGNVGTTGSARMNIYSIGRDEWLISPSIDLGTGNNYELVYDVAFTEYFGTTPAVVGVDDTLAVVISTDNGATWSLSNAVAIYDVNNNPPPTGQTDTIDLSSYSGNIKIGFYAASSVSNEDINVYIDNFIVRAPVTCSAVPNSSVTVSNISTSSADLSWLAGGTETSWQVQYDTAGFVPGTGNFAVTTTTVYNLTGLTAGTTYDCYVRGICAVGDTSVWTAFPSFSTPGDCSSSGSYTYGNNEDASNATNFIANTPGDWITLTFTAGISETGWDYWYVTDSLNGQGNVIATGDGDITLVNGGVFESTTGLISFYIDSDGSVTGSTFVYSASCSAPPACSAPSAFTATNVTTTSADLGWTAGNTATSFNLEYGSTGFTMGSGTYISGGTNPYSISGLMQGTTYDVYVQAVCSTGDSSTWAGPFSFTTSCGVNTAPWHESFSSAIPNCWSESGNMTAVYTSQGVTYQTGDNWNFTYYNAYGGFYMHIGGNYQDLTPFPFGYCAFVNGNEGGGTYGPATLTTPEVSVVPLTNPEVSFLLNSNRESDSVNAILDVEASNDGGTTWSSVATLQGNTNGWIRQHVSLSAYTGDTVQVRFVYSEPGTGSIAQLDHIAIDEITIGEAVTCFEISNLSLSNITGNSVDLNWVAGGSESAWDILASSSSGNVSAQSTDTTTTLTGLSSSTNYDIYVRAICGVGDTSAWYGPIPLYTYPDGPNGVTCGIGDTNATVFTDDCEDWSGWTGNFGAGTGIWSLGTGTTPSGGTGPSGAHEGSSYFFFEGSTGGSQFDTATIYSPLIDLSEAVGGSAELSFWLHAYGNNMGNLHIGASSTLTGTYTNLAIFSGQIQGSSNLGYANLGVDLSAYVGDTVYLSFTYTRNPLGGFTQDLAIDLIEVNSCIVPPSNDLALVAAAVASGCDLTATEPIELWVVNQGLVAESSFDLSYSVNGGTPVVESITSTLNVGDTLMHVFAATADMTSDGVYNIDFECVLASDFDTTNNTMMFMAENYLTPAALTTMGDTICNGDTAMVSTTANGYAFWYDAATGGNLVGEDDVIYVSPSSTTSYYAEDAIVIGHSEDFDSYNVGDYIVASDPSNWDVWPGGVPGGAYDMQVTDVQGNGGNSLRVFNVDGTDVVMEFGQALSTGRFYYSMDMYLVADGYINFQEDVVIGTAWNMSVTFINGVIDITIDGASVLTGSYTSTDPAGNTLWNTFEFECNYSTGVWEVFADGVSQGTFVNPDPVASVNIYPGTGVEYYLDNVEWSAVTDDACRSERTEAVVTVNDCSNIDELSFKDLNIYPNPNNGQFTITNSQEITDIIITDLQGKVVYNNNNINLNKVNVELIDLERGMYMINLKTIDGMITKTVTLQ